MTKLKYLDNSYLYESNAAILEFQENEKGKVLVLDETIFHPQGGGQPSDTGKIIFGNSLFEVQDVRMDDSGIIRHFGKVTTGKFQRGDNVILQIDKDKRLLHARLHSAGHLLDCAVSMLGFDNLKPTKGCHFASGSFVEYDGVIPNQEETMKVLQTYVDDLIKQDLCIEKEFINAEKAIEMGIHLPGKEVVRVIQITGFPPCGCGGTHVNKTSEIGKIIINKMKSKKGKTKINYFVT
jgi:Ser-tRNA(Ala) deacylase AlaX